MRGFAFPDPRETPKERSDMPTSACSQIPFFAITTRGLEDVSAAEIGSLDNIRPTVSGYRRIQGRCEGSLKALLSVRTVDDVYLHLGTWSGISRRRSTLKRLTSLSSGLDLDDATCTLSGVRRLANRPLFSVTASFVGRRNYTSREMKLAVAEGVTSNVPNLVYVDDDRQADLNLRLFVEHEMAWVGVRLAEDALNRRPYKRASVPGSLKAPVAASLVGLAAAGLVPETRRNSLLLDPFCGAGTILAEANLMGFQVLGGDIRSEAIDAARRNLGPAGASERVWRWDAARLPLDDGSVDRVVTNMPWGRQVTVNSSLERLYEASFFEMLRVLAFGGRILVLTSLPELLAPFRSRLVEQRQISLFGQTPSILVFEP